MYLYDDMHIITQRLDYAGCSSPKQKQKKKDNEVALVALVDSLIEVAKN